MSRAVDVVDLATTATTAYDRPDLTARLHHRRARLTSPEVRVLVVGEFKQGKSQLVNALLNATVCPVDDDVATAVPTLVRYAEARVAALVRNVECGRCAERTEVAVAELGRHVTDTSPRSCSCSPAYAEAGIPRNILAGGLVLVDTPGVGGLASSHGAATLAALSSADAVLMVSDAAQEYTAPELEFLATAARLCPHFACVLTKTDLHPNWERIMAQNEQHLAGIGLAAPIIPVSSVLRLHGARTGDVDVLLESGFPELISYLRDDVMGRSGELASSSAARDVLAVADQLAVGIRAELTAQEDPRRAEQLIADLTWSKARADDLRQRSARWQVTLNDGVADIQSDIDYDLRDRLRAISREAEQMVTDADPEVIWDQFAAWFHKQVTSATSANFVWAAERLDHLAATVAEHFAEDVDVVLPELCFDPTDSISGGLDVLEQPDDEPHGVVQKLFTGMRGGYGGLLMVGMATGIAGMGLLNPLSVGAGLLFGGRTVREESRRLLQRRQSDAKNAVRRHIDEVIFQIGKDSRDMLRRAQRLLRDHFTALAEEASTSLSASVAAAQSAVRTGASERDRRIRDLKAEIGRIEYLAAQAEELLTVQEPHDGIAAAHQKARA